MLFKISKKVNNDDRNNFCNNLKCLQIHHEYIAIYMYEFMEYPEIKRIKIHIAVTI